MDKLDSSTESTRIVPASNSSAASSNGSSRHRTPFRRPHIAVYRKRYLLLLMFILLSASNAFQWIEYAIIESYIVDYYSISTFWVNCTSTVYMLLYIIGILPATWLLDNYGLRPCLIVAALGNAVGSLIKCFSLGRDLWAVSMAGQTVAAAAQLFILNIPPLLAATWFPAHEVSRTTALGVFGNQLGIALGFLIPPKLMPEAVDNPDALSPAQQRTFSDSTQEGLRYLFYGGAIFTTAVAIAIMLFFRGKPRHPPSEAAAYAHEMRNEARSNEGHSSLKALMGNRNFLLLFLSYGLNTGVFYAISTVLAQLVSAAFGSNKFSESAGYMGMAITVSGIFGSIICGYILGLSNKFKLVTLLVYVCSLVGTVGFTLGLQLKSIWTLYVISCFLGFFMTGYLPIGFEFAAEVSYPEPEGTSAGLLNASAQVFGILFTYGSSEIITRKGDLYANVFYIAALAVGSVLTFLVKNDLKRQHAQIVAVNDSV